ncbi:CBS domain-containing protein [Methylomonas sp. MgM2]
MPISEFCTREVIIAKPDDSVLDAAKLMRQRNVGTVVVVEEREGHNVPIGIVTDRDLVVDIVAAEADPGFIRVSELMMPELSSVNGSCGVFEAIQYMRSKGVRRLPVVDDQHGLIGIVTLDDMLVLLSEELSLLSRLVESEQ